MKKGGSKRAHRRQKRLGQYYTPDWAVDYIIEHTLGLTLAEHPDRLLGEFSLLDPACGNGAFLVGALGFLAQQAESLDKIRSRLLFRSIIDSIHGIDVDPTALQDCRQRLEELSRTVLGIDAEFSQKILLGNSLVQTDDAAQTIFGDRLNDIHPVDWHRVYPWVMRDGGFDVIVGNPPFLSTKAMDPSLKDYIRQKFRTVHQQFDIIIPFIELGLRLLRPGGRLGFIISNKVLAADYGINLRKTLVTSYVIERMVDISHLNIFEDAATYPHIIIIRRPIHPGETRSNKIRIIPPPHQPKDLTNESAITTLLPQQYYASLPNTILAPTLTEKKFAILRKMFRNTTPLGKACKIRCGIAKTGFTKHLLTQENYEQLSMAKKRNALPFLNAGDVRRYHIRSKKYLSAKTALVSDDQWKDFQEPKIVIAGMAKFLRAAYDTTGHALGRVYYITQNHAPYHPLYLLAVLNSQLINAYFTLLFVATHLRSNYIRYNATYLEQIPLAQPTQQQEDALVDLAQYVLMHPSYLKRGLDEEINQVVSVIYGLSPEEVNHFLA
ncbi:MAG: Eco57I restriction-modification methylase domain-containing protein [Candidatus Hodarchaeota archaeon]